MKKIFIILVAAIGFGSSAFAQSTVYFCYDVMFCVQKIPIKINGEDAFSLIGEPKKIGFEQFFNRSKKKCTLYQEGKVIFSFDTPAKNTLINPPITYQWADEIQLTLSKGSVHYIKIKTKGSNAVQFEELSEKDGAKEFAKKKYTPNPDYVEQNTDNSSGSSSKKSKEPTN